MDLLSELYIVSLKFAIWVIVYKELFIINNFNNKVKLYFNYVVIILNKSFTYIFYNS